MSTVLNVSTIIAPKSDIYLVGNDFSGSEYFYEKELENLDINWKDFSYDLVKKNNKHLSYQKFAGTTINDKMYFIKKSISEKGINLFCTNPESLLVKESNIKFSLLTNKN